MTYPGIERDPAAAALDPDRAAVEQRRREREQEFGTYVAVTDIPWGTVTAFVTGDPVNKSTVERYGWLDLGLVKRVGDEPTQPSTPLTGTAAALSRPNKSATKADWVDYAVSRGEDREQAEAMTRDDLVAKYQES